MSFPAYAMVSSHNMLEGYFHDSAVEGDGVKLMQLFHAMPAGIVEDALSRPVIDTLQDIQDAEAAAALAESVASADGDGDDDEDRDGEERGGDEGDEAHGGRSASRSAAAGAGAAGGGAAFTSDTDASAAIAAVSPRERLTKLFSKYTVGGHSPTRFYAYSILSEEELRLLHGIDESGSSSSSGGAGTDVFDRNAYINRFELNVAVSFVDYSNLGKVPGAALHAPAPQSAAPTGAGGATASQAAAGEAAAGGAGVAKSTTTSTAALLESGSGGSMPASAWSRAVSSVRMTAKSLQAANAAAAEAAEAEQRVAAEEKQRQFEQDYHATKEPPVKKLNVFSISPVNIAINLKSVPRTAIQCSIEVNVFIY
jgi:hypothetical protein